MDMLVCHASEISKEVCWHLYVNERLVELDLDTDNTVAPAKPT